MRDLLDSVATHNPGLLEKFGGHAMAAGLTLPKANFARFAEAFDAEVRKSVDPVLLQREILYDGALPADCFTLEFADELRTLTPWGQHCPEPLFADEFVIHSHRILADKHLKLSVSAVGQSQKFDAIAFNQRPAQPLVAGGRVHLLYKLDVNEYRGERALQLMVERCEFL